ncbi:MAG: phosphatase PAP2/dual specificity phosphatase family protein [Planctomycetes bacterium]|nr:phosphatase PAP2/dual specificity phosphatase family protein [Planctomycetota bacterium]MCB9889110.1 phosphatase PAP2/dual specificity phosphatase family protein [Planctomycetota bacterium]
MADSQPDASSTARPWRAAALASAGCSLLFVVVYSATNAIASSRTDVGSFAWDWELDLPLIEWLIVPYMSIDAFFVATPFLCTGRREVRILAARICTAVLVAGACFLVWPLRLAFERPQVDGALGPVFEFLHGFDQPFNLFPSLHVTLIFILRWTWHRHVRGAWRWLMHGWFVLVTLSTVFTHQHQVIDLAGGLVLAMLVFYLFPTGLIARRDHVVTRAPSPRLASRFAGGAALLALLAWGVSRWSWIGFWLAVWGALALVLVAAGYAKLGPRVFRKYAGYLSLPARFLLWPYLLPLWTVRVWHWSREPEPFAAVTDGVLFGRLPDAALAKRLRGAGVRAVLDLTAEHSETPALRGGDYLELPVLDLTTPEPAVLDRAVEFVERRATAESGAKVYVHCALGYERSATVVAAWLLHAGRCASVDEAVERVCAMRSRRVPTERVRRAVTAWWECGGRRAVPTLAPTHHG